MARVKVKAKAKAKAKGGKQFKSMLVAGPGVENGNGLEAAIVAGVGEGERENSIYWIPLEQVDFNPYQPRLSEDAEHILGLAKSIHSMKEELRDTLGLQQIPMGRLGMMRPSAGSGQASAGPGSEEVFEPLPAELLASRVHVEGALAAGAVVQLAFGHSRWWAFTVLAKGVGEVFPGLGGDSDLVIDADYQKMPLRLVQLDDRAMSDHAATENAQRKNITPLEEAFALYRRVNDLRMSQAEAGRPFGFSNVQVSNKLRLLRLPEFVQDRLQSGELSETHGRALLQLVNAPHLIERVLENVEKRGDGMPGSRQLLAMVAEVVCWETESIEVELKSNEAEAVSRVAWPMGWEPTAEEVESLEGGFDVEEMRGACVGCAFLVQIGKEKSLRCSDLVCRRKKDRVWAELEKQRQIALMMERYGEERVFERAGNGHWKFSRYMASPALITSGACSMESCACLNVVYEEWNSADCERPDVENAPQMVFACSDIEAVNAKEDVAATAALNQLLRNCGEGGGGDSVDEEECERRVLRREREGIKQENEQIGEVGLARLLEEAGGIERLFKERGFLVFLLNNLNYSVEKGQSVEELQMGVVRSVMERECRRFVTYSGSETGAGYVGWDGKKVDSFIAKAVGRKGRCAKSVAAQLCGPSGVDSAMWKDGWEKGDDEEWLMVEAMGSQLVLDLVTRPRCALRLVDGATEKGERAKWWRRYNALVKG